MTLTSGEMVGIMVVASWIGGMAVKHGPYVLKLIFGKNYNGKSEGLMPRDEHERICEARISAIQSRLNDINKRIDDIVQTGISLRDTSMLILSRIETLVTRGK